jgi:glycosyltransferase involved in cell wall biosynthesis
VVIPTKNEEGAIFDVIEEVRKVLDGTDHEIVVVDSSSDKTPIEAVRAGAKLIRQVGNGGVGEALIQGFYWAKGENIVFLDGDATYDPQDIMRVAEPLLKGEADIVNGNRFANMEKGAMPMVNRVGNHLLTWFGNLLFRTNLRDSQSGLKGFRRNLLRYLVINEKGFPIVSEIIAEGAKLNLRIAEVGVTYRRRIGQSKLNPARAGPSIFWASLRMLRDYRPIFLFGAMGILFLAVGFYAALPVILEYAATGTFSLFGRALIAIFCWLAGLLSIFTGFVLDTMNYSIKKIEARLAKQS